MTKRLPIRITLPDTIYRNLRPGVRTGPSYIPASHARKCYTIDAVPLRCVSAGQNQLIDSATYHSKGSGAAVRLGEHQQPLQRGPDQCCQLSRRYVAPEFTHFGAFGQTARHRRLDPLEHLGELAPEPVVAVIALPNRQRRRKVAERASRHVRVLRLRGADLVQKELQTLLRSAVCALQRSHHARLLIREPQVQNRKSQLFLTLEVVVEVALRDSAALQDVVYGGPGV